MNPTTALTPTPVNFEDLLVEIAEVHDHPFMLGSQFHPELKSRPNRPHPLFRDFLKAAASLAGEQLPLDGVVAAQEIPSIAAD